MIILGTCLLLFELDCSTFGHYPGFKILVPKHNIRQSCLKTMTELLRWGFLLMHEHYCMYYIDQANLAYLIFLTLVLKVPDPWGESCLWSERSQRGWCFPLSLLT